MNAVAFAAGKLSDSFLLIRARKVKTRNVCAGIHFTLAEQNQIQTVGNFVKDGFSVIQRIARLVNVAEFDGFADFKIARIRFFLFR